jgi:ubiquinone/menaquinone biosynthesis C-methylase UbiE
MLRKLNAWWIMLRNVGDQMRLGRQIDQLFRYYILETLDEEGLFNYLKEPRTYGQILTEFNYVDNDYTQGLFEVLSSDKHNVIIKEENIYRINPDQPLPMLSDVADTMGKPVHAFGLMAKGMARYIPPRLRNESIELSETFEADGRQLMTKFDKTLGSKIYVSLRKTCFAFLTGEERKSLRGKKLLEVGCGSGRETAELWLMAGGDIQITAIDPIQSMLELAERHFADYLDELEHGHPPLTDANRPVFEPHSATNLPYEDNSFDAVFNAFVLHWTPDPQKAISEMVRVLKPGGLIFGLQPTKPAANPYFDLVVRINENCYGFFWVEEFRRWYAAQGVELDTMTPVTLFRGHKPDRPTPSPESNV